MLRHDDLKAIDKKFAKYYSCNFGTCAICGHRNFKFKPTANMIEDELTLLDMYLSIPGNKMPKNKPKMPKKIDGAWQSACIACVKRAE